MCKSLQHGSDFESMGIHGEQMRLGICGKQGEEIGTGNSSRRSKDGRVKRKAKACHHVVELESLLVNVQPLL